MSAPNTPLSGASSTGSTSTTAPVVLVTGAAKRLGREIALKLAANGWRVAVHYRDSVEGATKTVADCARSTRGAAAFRCDLGNETAVRILVPTVIKHLRSNAGAAILLSQALHTHLNECDAFGAVVNLLDQKLWNQNPDFMSHPLSKAALKAASVTLALAPAPRVRVAGAHVEDPRQSDNSASSVPALALSYLEHWPQPA